MFEALPLEIKARIASELEDSKEDLTSFRLINKTCADLPLSGLFHHCTVYMFVSDLERLENLSRYPRIARHVRSISFEVAYLPVCNRFRDWKRHVKVATHCNSEHMCKSKKMRQIFESLDNEEVLAKYSAYVEALKDQTRLLNGINPGRLGKALRAFSGLTRIDINSSMYSSFQGDHVHNIELTTLTIMETLACAECSFNDMLHIEIFNAIHEGKIALETLNLSEMPMRLVAPNLPEPCLFNSSTFHDLVNLRLLTGCPGSLENMESPITGTRVFESILKSSNHIDEITLGANGAHGLHLDGVDLCAVFPAQSNYYANLSWLNLNFIRLNYDDFIEALSRLMTSLNDITFNSVFLEHGDWISVFQFLATTNITMIHFLKLETVRGIWDAIPCSEGPCQGKDLPKTSLFMQLWNFLFAKGTLKSPLQSLRENDKAEIEWLKKSDKTMRYSLKMALDSTDGHDLYDSGYLPSGDSDEDSDLDTASEDSEDAGTDEMNQSSEFSEESWEICKGKQAEANSQFEAKDGSDEVEQLGSEDLVTSVNVLVMD